jgi:hypothetical protein
VTAITAAVENTKGAIITKTRFLGFLCAVPFAAGILLGAATASAHGMTYWEATLVLDDMTTGGQNQLEPRKATLSDVRKAIVRAGLADDYRKEDFTGDGFRFVTFSFNYGEKFAFRSVTGAKDTRDAGELTITSYDVMGQSVRTLGGLRVGKSYESIEEMYGNPSFSETNEDGLTAYTYAFEDKAAALTFDIDDAGIIQAIHFRSEI